MESVVFTCIYPVLSHGATAAVPLRMNTLMEPGRIPESSTCGYETIIMLPSKKQAGRNRSMACTKNCHELSTGLDQIPSNISCNLNCWTYESWPLKTTMALISCDPAYCFHLTCMSLCYPKAAESASVQTQRTQMHNALPRKGCMRKDCELKGSRHICIICANL